MSSRPLRLRVLEMQVFRKLEDVPADFGLTLVSIGNFDGVHRAHSYVLREIVTRAQQQGAKAMAVTFEPHPVRILRPDSGLKLITPTPEKLRLLQASGLDAVLLLPFGRDLSLMTPRQFAEEILRKRLHAREVHEGFNFHFGHKAEGNVHLLAELGHELGFEAKDGVYITRTRVTEECFDSVTNLGGRPTFGAESFAVETHLLNFHPIELGPETEVEIHFLQRLRDEIKFPSVAALREQIARDVKKARRYFHLLNAVATVSPAS